MADKSVRVVLSASVAGFKSGMEQAAKSVDRVGASAAKLSAEKGWGHIEKAAIGASIAVVGAVGSMIKTYADFDEAMSQVGAATGASADDLGKLKQAAMDAGAEFGQFSSTDAAGAIEELGKAGLATSEIIGGGLRGAMALAAADGMAVADAAELTADALMMFGKSGEDATKVADLLAQGAGAATGSAHDLGMALSQVGAVANSMGLTIEDTTTSLAVFAANGIKGSDAGTSLKTMLMSLANPSVKARNEMERLGVEAFNAQGEFVGMRDLSEQLQTKLGALSVEQRNASLAMMFGSDAMRVAAVLTSKGAEGYDEMAKSMAGFGSAADMAAKRTNNLKGDIAEFSGAWENLSISLGEAGDGLARGAIQGLTDLIELASRNKGTTTTILAIAGGMVALGATAVGAVRVATALGEVRTAIASLHIADKAKSAVRGVASSFEALAGASTRSKVALGGALGALVALNIAGAAYQRSIDGAMQSTEAMTASLLSLSKGGKGIDAINADIERMGTSASDIGDAFAFLDGQSGGWDKFGRDLGKAIPSMFGMKSATEQYREEIDRVDKALAGLDDTQAIDAFNAFVRESGVSAEQAAGHFDDYRNKLLAVANAAGVTDLTNKEIADWMGGKMPAALAKTEGAVKTLGQQLAATTESQEASIKAAEEQYDAYMTAANGALKLSGTQMGLEAAIDDATASLKENGKTLDIGSEKGRANRAALDGIASSTLSLLESQRSMSATAEELTATTNKGRKAFIDTAVQMGMNKDVAAKLADSYGLIPEEVATTVTAPGAAKSKAEADAFKKVLDSLPASEQTIVKSIYETQGYEAAMQAWRNIQALSDKTIYVNVRQTSTKGVQVPVADGAVMDFYRNGGVREHHVAQIAPAGAWRVWAEPETGGEAYIPLSLSKRDRSMDILEEVARRFGVAVRPFADGAVSAPSYTPSYASAVTIAAPSGPMQISGTLDLGDGLTGRIVGVLSDATTASNRRRAY